MEYRYLGRNINSDDFSAAVDFDKFIMVTIEPFKENFDFDEGDVFIPKD